MSLGQNAYMEQNICFGDCRNRSKVSECKL